MSKKSGIIYSVAILLAIIIVGVIVGIMVKNKAGNPDKSASSADAEITTGLKADVDAIPLPSDTDLKPVSNGKIWQIDNLTDKFVLRNYDVDQTDGSVTYYYQTHMATSGERLMIISKPMTQADFDAQLPKDNVKKDTYNGIEFTYASRMLYYLKEGKQVGDEINQLVKDNVAVVEFGNTMDEVIDMQCMYWYEDGVGYTMKAYYHGFSFEDMCELTHYFIDNRK